MEPRPHVPVIDKYGIRAVTAHTGNPLAHSFSLARYAGVLLGMSGMPVTFSPGTVDQWPKNLSSHLMYGRWWGFPVPDIERTDLLVIMGPNPAESQGSLLAAPDVMALIKRIRRRGKVVVIDPVRTRTAAQADERLPITPGTDAAFLLAITHTLFDEDLVSLGALAPHVKVSRRCGGWPPTGHRNGCRPRLSRRLTRPGEELVLVSRRHLRSNNSWLHNVPALMKGRDRCTLLMHPDDAHRCGVAHGDIVTARSQVGEIQVPVEVTDAIKRGAVSMPHGWGHGKPGTRMAVANGAPGANTNVLSPPTFLDEPSGNGALNGIPVTVSAL